MVAENGLVRTALVTGSSRGIGEAVTRRLAQDGYRVAVVARDSEAVERVVMSLDNKDLGHIGISADLMSQGGRETLFEQIPPEDLDCIVHNLGGSLGLSNFWASVDDYSSVWNFNVGVAHELNAAVVPKMVSRGEGRLIFVSTLATRLGKGNAPYVVAKAGLEAYIRQLSRELKGSGVIAAGVRPGAIRVPNRYLANLELSDPDQFEIWLRENNSGVHMGSPDEIAGVVAFLCSSDSSYLSGTIIDADGGV